jgi:hypothetical protein
VCGAGGIHSYLLPILLVLMTLSRFRWVSR